ncbi:MAG TPA: hypothetical protein VFZ63_04685 [Jiangellaceae bacterium]
MEKSNGWVARHVLRGRMLRGGWLRGGWLRCDYGPACTGASVLRTGQAHAYAWPPTTVVYPMQLRWQVHSPGGVMSRDIGDSPASGHR